MHEILMSQNLCLTDKLVPLSCFIVPSAIILLCDTSDYGLILPPHTLNLMFSPLISTYAVNVFRLMREA